MTREECKAEVLEHMGETLKVSAGLALDAPWASSVIDELQDTFYPDPAYDFSELDVAGLLMKVRLRWEAGGV